MGLGLPHRLGPGGLGGRWRPARALFAGNGEGARPSESPAIQSQVSSHSFMTDEKKLRRRRDTDSSQVMQYCAFPVVWTQSSVHRLGFRADFS